MLFESGHRNPRARSAFFARLLGLLLLPALTAVGAAAQCAAPNFPAPILSNAGYRVSDIAAGDFNKDGRTDFAVANAYSNFVTLLTCTQAGAITNTKFNVGSPQERVALADFNNDTKLDLVTLHATSVSLRLGNGLGGFGAASTVVISGYNLDGSPLVVADFNNDTKPDVFVGDQSTGTCSLLFGNGLGGLKAPLSVPLYGNTSAAAGDFNGDNNADLVFKGQGGAFFYLALGDGTGHFGAPVSFTVAASSYITTADFNLDNKLDIITAGDGGVSVRLGNGLGQFGAAKTFGAGFTPRTVAVADMNGDGKPDLVPAGSNNVGVLLGLGTGLFSPATRYALIRSPVAVAVGDFNGDGKADVWAPTTSAGGLPPLGGGAPPFDTALFFAGDGAGKLRYPSAFKSGASPFAIAGGDVNNDGKPDLVVANIGHNNLSVHKGNGTGGFTSPATYTTGTQPRAVAVGDLNNDGKPDLVTANYEGGNVSVLLGTGTGFRARTDVHVPGFNPSHVAIGDFNRDGKADLAVVYGSDTGVSILLGDGAGRFGAAASFATPYSGQHVSVADFNGDGKSDLAVGYIGGVATLHGDGNGDFVPDKTLVTNSAVTSLGVADFNDDGKADLAAVHGSTYTLAIFLGNGLGDFTTKSGGKLGSDAQELAVADFNGDGRPDVATANYGGTVSLLTGKGAGDFNPAVTYVSGGHGSRSLLAGDFNSDGRPDLALAHQSSNSFDPPPLPASVSLMLNTNPAPPPAAPALSVADVSVTEGNTGALNATVTIKLSSASTRPVAVSYYTADVGALNGVDYQTAAGRVVFAPGVTSKRVAVAVVGDALDEADETVAFLLADPVGAGVGRGRALVKIVDNDPLPALSVNDVTLTEGNSGAVNAVFTVTLSKASGRTVTVKYATADGTAVALSDYKAKPLATLTFLPGETTKTVAVQVLRELVTEPNETFFVNLSEPLNATVTDAQGVGTILNDD
ncbi:MAG TPA: FG-GAP-like repeat-containing protein [Pyrinomonadaceae bacterium]|nr:FG-GAP-like repeat-containing protein [Pyrinomonadaceae bacterium]